MDTYPPFEFLGYNFDENSHRASFRYRGGTVENPLEFTEIVKFSVRAESLKNYNHDVLDYALGLAFAVIGTSYYKAFPTRNVKFNLPLAGEKIPFMNAIYQDGLSQFAYENHLTRADLAHFSEVTFPGRIEYTDTPYTGSGKLVLQSGGKDSLLTSALLNETGKPWTALYVSSSNQYPKILNYLGANQLQIIERQIDYENLEKAK